MNKYKLLFLVQLPPPVHGVSAINKFLINSELFNLHFESSRVIPTDLSKEISEIQNLSPIKLLRFGLFYLRVFWSLVFFRPSHAYYTIPPVGIGFLKELPVVLLLKLFRVRCIYHIHGKGVDNWTQKNPQLKHFYRFVFNSSSIIHLSQLLYIRDFASLGLRNVKYDIVANGILEDYVESKVFVETERLRIIFMSNLFSSKGIWLAFDILDLASRDINKTIEFNIIGSVPSKENQKRLENLIRDSSKFSIKYHGAKYGREKYNILREMDLALFPTLNDTFPLVVLEFLSMGIPVVASDQGAIPEILTAETGAIFQSGDIKSGSSSLKMFVSMYLNNPAFIKEKCVALYNENYTKKHFEARMLKAIKKLM